MEDIYLQPHARLARLTAGDGATDHSEQSMLFVSLG